MAHEGYASEHLFLLICGESSWLLHDPSVKKFLSSGFHPVKFLAGAAFLSKPTDYLLSPEALTDSTVLVWDRTTIRSFSAKNPGLLENRLLKAYDYFVVYRSLHISATCHTARQRLAQGLGISPAVWAGGLLKASSLMSEMRSWPAR
jgi:CRP-like cAMP-binding protein